jgi:hypothetical protein
VHFQLRFNIEQLIQFFTASLKIDGNTIAEGSIRLLRGNMLIYEGILKRDDAKRLCLVTVAALRSYGKDPAWNRTGLDGFVINGSFESPYCTQQKFACWSPAPGTLPHTLISTAVECLPINHDDPRVEFDVERVRQLFGKGSPVRLTTCIPPTLRIMGIVRSPEQIAAVLSQLPETSDLIVDIENARVHEVVRAALLPLTQRAHPVQWIINGRDLKWLKESGVGNSSILNLAAANKQADYIERELAERTRHQLERREKAQRLAARIAEKGVACPNCWKVTQNIRFIDPGFDGRPYFVCRFCNRSFTQDEVD